MLLLTLFFYSERVHNWNATIVEFRVTRSLEKHASSGLSGGQRASNIVCRYLKSTFINFIAPLPTNFTRTFCHFR